MTSIGSGLRTEFLPFAPPFIGDEEVEGVVNVLRSGWLSRGPLTGRFEEEFRTYLGAPAALGLNSGTAGLHLALLAMGIGPGDDVIVPTMTFCACANVVEHVGARPVLVDVEPDTLNLDPTAVEAALTRRTRVIMAVHYGGQPADLDAILEIARGAGVQVIEDAAHALPAEYRGELVGASGRLTAFSFYASKNLTTGEGGMLTGDPELLARASVLSLHGMSADAWQRYTNGAPWYYEVTVPGFKYNMTDLQAAIGLAQLAKLDEMQRRRYEVVEMYGAGLRDLDAIQLPTVRDNVSSAWHLYPIRIRPGAVAGGRNAFIGRLSERRIGSSVHFIPIHLHPYYRDRYRYTPADYPVAQAAFEQLVSLPLHAGLTDTDVTDVIEATRAAAGR